MKKFVKCKHCGNREFIDIDTSIAKFDDGEENEYLQKECFKLQKRIDKLQYKHDFEDMPNWKFENINMQISALTKIKDILEQYIYKKTKSSCLKGFLHKYHYRYVAKCYKMLSKYNYRFK